MRPLRILITGASGLVGAEVTAKLARLGHIVIGLVHRQAASPSAHFNVAVPTLIASGALSKGTITYLRGDVRATDLGLSANNYDYLCNNIDLIIHGAALTDFGQARTLYHAVNVEGTANLLTLAFHRKSGPTPFIHVSTAYVCGDRTGLIGEDELDAGQEFGNWYEETKFLAELLVRQARDLGLPLIVARPSIVVGASSTGEIRDFKNLYIVLRIVTRGGIKLLPGNYEATLDLVPIDYISHSLVTLAEDFISFEGRTLHLVGGRTISLRELTEVLAEYPGFHVPRFVSPEDFRLADLRPIERRYYQRIVSLYEHYFTKRVRFEAPSDLSLIPPFASSLSPKPFIRTLIDYCRSKKYLHSSLLRDRLSILQ